jgi:hypothetical protein
VIGEIAICQAAIALAMARAAIARALANAAVRWLGRARGNGWCVRKEGIK